MADDFDTKPLRLRFQRRKENVLNTAPGPIYGPRHPDGVMLTSIEHPPGLIDALADAIRSGKLSLKRRPNTPS